MSPGHRCRVLLPILAVVGVLRSQEAPEPPQALVLAATGAQVLRAGSELPLTARPGEVLFSGDSLRTAEGSVTLIACAAKSQQTISNGADVLFEARGPKLRAGRIIDTKPAEGCFLPPLPRAIVASQQHAGAAIAVENSREVVAQTFQQRLAQLSEPQRSQLTSELTAIDAAVAANPNDPVIHLKRAAALDRAGLAFDAAEEMKHVSEAWPDAGWTRSRVFVLEEKGGKNAAATAPPAPEQPEVEGNTYALLVGISSFQDPNVPPLGFAHQDANDLAKLLKSPRAGGIPEDNLVLLVNEKATRAAIQSAIETHLKARAGKDDTILLFIASHGTIVSKKGYIVAYDSHPEDLATSGIPMDDIKKLFQDQLANVKRLFLYVDVCHAGAVGQISAKPEETNRVTAAALTNEELQMFGMLAAQKGQVAREGVNWGGGHGAFSYFLMDALNGSADINKDGKVTITELYHYVVDKVEETTNNLQSPKQLGDLDETRVLAQVGKPGIELKEYSAPAVVASRSIPSTTPRVGLPAAPSALTSRQLRYRDLESVLADYHAAIDEGRILPTQDRSAFTYLNALRQKIAKPEDFRPEAEKLRIALEDKGQQVLRQYLAGEATPQNSDDFVRGQRYFEAALLIAPDSLYLQSRMYFCEGRAAIFAKNYTGATGLLERSIGLDGQRAYAYNALGIIALERADYDRAIPAFHEASKRAPYWAYPMHNLALAYMEKGDFDSAIRTYLRAMMLAPRVAYLPYNLGLLYQRINRLRDAEQQYRKALAIEPGNAQAMNAMGALKASEGHRTEAEQFYKQALEADPALLAARHNLALLLASDPKRAAEAPPLWRDNLARDPQHLPSRLALARYLATSGDKAGAAQEYAAVIAARPDYVAARVALADVRPTDAIAQLEAALQIQPDNPDLLERVAQAYSAAGRKSDADAAWKKALALAGDGAARKRIRQALAKQ
jgi:tetratricopeptide (TPR) repeat protein